MQPDWSTPAKRLKYAREWRGLSQVQLSLLSGFRQEQISQWENGRKHPVPRSWRALGQALNVAWYWLALGLDKEPATAVKQANFTKEDYATLPAEAYQEATPDDIARHLARVKR